METTEADEWEERNLKEMNEKMKKEISCNSYALYENQYRVKFDLLLIK